MKISPSIQRRFHELVEQIETGASRYGALTFWPKMEIRLKRLSNTLPDDLLAYLWALHGHKSGHCSLEDTVHKLEAIRVQPRSSKLAMLHATSLLSVITFKRISTRRNFGYRKDAIILARGLNDIVAELQLETNWIFALINLKRNKQAGSRLKTLEMRLAKLPPQKAKLDKVKVIKGRVLGHKAKVNLVLAAQQRDYEHLRLGNEFYGQAVEVVQQLEHHRVNLLIEWANRLGDVLEATHHPGLIKEAKEKLARANRGLDSHDCGLCEAYFFFVEAFLCYLQGNLQYNSNRGRALELWEEAIRCAESSIEAYRKTGHHLVNEPEFMKKMATKKIKISKQPSKIFLSHKTVDKPLVKRFEHILQQLGFEPWLDEHSLPPGTALSRKIQEGMRASCACVFFITKDFKDEKYLAFEIELAKTVQIERRSEAFAIIPIVFGGDFEVPQMVKDLGKYIVAENEIQVLSEILHWLPIKVGSVYSPALLKEEWEKMT